MTRDSLGSGQEGRQRVCKVYGGLLFLFLPGCLTIIGVRLSAVGCARLVRLSRVKIF